MTGNLALTIAKVFDRCGQTLRKFRWLVSSLKTGFISNTNAFQLSSSPLRGRNSKVRVITGQPRNDKLFWLMISRINNG
jgi:hypothetical protein